MVAMSSIRYSRLDGRKSSSSSWSSFLSTAMVFAFVSLCLVGVWMMNSPLSIFPGVQNTGESSGAATKLDVSAQSTLDEITNNANEESKQSISENSPPSDGEGEKTQLENNNNNGNVPKDEGNGDAKQGEFQDSNGDVPKDEGNGDVKQREFQDNNGNVPKEEGNGAAKQTEFQDNNGNVPKEEGNGDAKQSELQGNDGNVPKVEGNGDAKQGEFQESNGNVPKEEGNGDAKQTEFQDNNGNVPKDEANNPEEQSSNGKRNPFENENGDVPKNETDGDVNNNIQQEETSSGKQNQFENNNSNVSKDVKKGDAKNQQGESNASSENNQQEKPVEEKNREDGKVESVDGKMGNGQIEKEQQQVEENTNDKQLNQDAAEKKESEETNKGQSSDEVYPSGDQSGLLKETNAQNGSFSTQAQESKKEKEANKAQESSKDSSNFSGLEKGKVFIWRLCKTMALADYIPCLDNLEAIRHLHSTKHYEHRERHCPQNPPTCLVPLPQGYKTPIQWPTSRAKIWYHNVPHTKLVEYKGRQNWVKVSGEYLVFPGGGTQFQHGALHYIDVMQKSVPEIAWGKHTRVVLDVGCGVASFGGYLFERDVLTMSVAPKDEHEAQVQFALERGIPAMSAVMGTERLPFPGNVFDVVHCARCRVPWHIEGGKLLLELNRMLRPGGFFVWSATPIYRKNSEDAEIWEAMKRLTKSMCWEQVKISRDKMNGVAIAFYRKPVSNQCYEKRKQKQPLLCPEADDQNAAWNVSLQTCLHKVPVAANERGSKWPHQWPTRLEETPYWLPSSQVGVYGKPAPEDLAVDTEHWKNVVQNSYLNGMGIQWSTVRNVMDMRSIYGGFAAALKGMNVWVMNIVTIDDPDTLPIIYERGLFGVYHNWCESFSTYPRTYDLLHANHLFSIVKNKCNYMAFVAEVDRILRPGGKLLVRDSADTITELEFLLRSMHWEIQMTFSENKEGFLCAQRTMWRPQEFEVLAYAMD